MQNSTKYNSIPDLCTSHATKDSIQQSPGRLVSELSSVEQDEQETQLKPLNGRRVFIILIYGVNGGETGNFQVVYKKLSLSSRGFVRGSDAVWVWRERRAEDPDIVFTRNNKWLLHYGSKPRTIFCCYGALSDHGAVLSSNIHPSICTKFQ
jgi:hypothetical protein